LSDADNVTDKVAKVSLKTMKNKSVFTYWQKAPWTAFGRFF